MGVKLKGESRTLCDKLLADGVFTAAELAEAKKAAEILSITDQSKITTKASVLAALREELSAGLAASIDEEKKAVELSLIGNAYMKLVFENLPKDEIEAYRLYWRYEFHGIDTYFLQR